MMIVRIGMPGGMGYVVFRHRQTNANPRFRGKWRLNVSSSSSSVRTWIFAILHLY